MAKPKYPVIDDNFRARFEYDGVQRVVQVIATENGCITGYETKKGKIQRNKTNRFVRSYKLGKISNLTLSTR